MSAPKASRSEDPVSFKYGTCGKLGHVVATLSFVHSLSPEGWQEIIRRLDARFQHEDFDVFDAFHFEATPSSLVQGGICTLEELDRWRKPSNH